MSLKPFWSPFLELETSDEAWFQNTFVITVPRQATHYYIIISYYIYIYILCTKILKCSITICNNILMNCDSHSAIIKFFKLYFIMNNHRCYFSHTKWLISHSPLTAIVRNLILINNLLIPAFNKIHKRFVNPCVFFFFFSDTSLSLCPSLLLALSHSRRVFEMTSKQRYRVEVLYNNKNKKKNNNILCTHNFCWIIILFTSSCWNSPSQKCVVIILSHIKHPFWIDTFSYTIDVAGSFIVAFFNSHNFIPRDKQIFNFFFLKGKLIFNDHVWNVYLITSE